MGHIKIKTKSWTIVLHKSPDADALYGAWIMCRWGERKYRGISKANFLFWSGGLGPILKGEKVITIDVGGGMYDHHPVNKFPGWCAATLVAHDLEIEKDLGLVELLSYIKKHDLKGIRSSLDLADFVRCLNRQHPKQPKKVMDMIFKVFDALYKFLSEGRLIQQQDRNQVADIIESWMEEKENHQALQKIKKFVIDLRNGNRSPFDLTTIFLALEKRWSREIATGLTSLLLEAKYSIQEQFGQALKELLSAEITTIKDMKIVTIRSDNPMISPAARYKLNAAMIIQRNTSGRTIIFTNNRFFLAEYLQRIVAIIRLEEQMADKRRYLVTSFWRLISPGKIPEAEEWYFQREDNDGGGKMLNGSFTSPDVLPTKLSLSRIQKIVKEVLRLGRNFRWDVWCYKEYGISL